MTCHPVSDLATFLRGHWAVHREIMPLRDAPSGAFEGEAEFVPRCAGPDGPPVELVYLEQGVARIGDHRGDATRQLRYEQTGGRAHVRFDDGRFFHDLDLREGVWHADHPCGDDLYQGRFRVLGPDAWEQTWTVTGPSAEYRIHTYLTRSDPSAPRPPPRPGRGRD